MLRLGRFWSWADGSGRDSVYLARQGHQVVATDLDGETLVELQKRFEMTRWPSHPLMPLRSSFPTTSFDVVFHNGLWVLFEDDAFIHRLMVEQARVAKRYAVIMVHNALNPTLVKQFKKGAETDEL